VLSKSNKKSKQIKQTVMKNIIIVLAMFIASQAYGQAIFSNVSFENTRSRSTITFSTPSEANVVHYRIEASNTGADYEILGIVRASGNSVLPRTYHYPLYGSEYKYYRIGKVGMGGKLQYSQVISAPKVVPAESPANDITVMETNAIVNKK
jgi:hypothetical protein